MLTIKVHSAASLFYVGDIVLRAYSCLKVETNPKIYDLFKGISPLDRRNNKVLTSKRDLNASTVWPLKSCSIIRGNRHWSKLNKTQQRALSSLQYTFEGIQGPPGTGKSTLIAHLLQGNLLDSELIMFYVRQPTVLLKQFPPHILSINASLLIYPNFPTLFGILKHNQSKVHIQTIFETLSSNFYSVAKFCACGST